MTELVTEIVCCRQITDSFRKSYALLWQSLIFADAEGIKEHSQAMNAGDMYPLFAGMLTNRPWDEVCCCNPGEKIYKIFSCNLIGRTSTRRSFATSLSCWQY